MTAVGTGATPPAPDPVAAIDRALDAMADDRRAGVWIDVVDPVRARAAADLATGADLPLAGLSVAVKGNIDVAGFVTTAGCPAYGDRATASAPVVAAIEAAGGVVVGTTTLDQFATGLVGTRSPHGPCPNAFWPDLVSGGSSSGSAVAVATGQADVALGTDTAGSGRVPAAANGIVGIKPTRALVSRAGVVPACRSLDCVSVFATTVARAAAVAEVLWSTTPDPHDPWSRGARPAPAPRSDRPLRVGIVASGDLFVDGDPGGAVAHRDALAAVAATGADLVEIDLSPFVEAGRLLYGGAFVAERYAAVGRFVDAHPDAIDPVVRSIVATGRDVAGWEVYRDLAELERLRAATAPTWEAVDVLCVPSVPRIPTRAEVAADPLGPNSMLGHYTNFVNLLDLCALTFPVGDAEPARPGPPPSLTLIGPAWTDRTLVHLADRATTTTGRT